MLHERIDYLLKTGGVIHIRGESGTGKTLLATRFAAAVSRSNRVDWLCADGKKAFASALTRNVIHYGGMPSNIMILQPKGHVEARAAIMSLRETVNYNTRLIVIDPVTRVLNLGIRDLEMWDRVLVEEILPTIAGLAAEIHVCFILTSEVRMLDEQNVPIHQGIIRKWTDLEIFLERSKTDWTTINLLDQLEGLQHIGDMRLTEEGIVEISTNYQGGDQTDCSESTCTV